MQQSENRPERLRLNIFNPSFSIEQGSMSVQPPSVNTPNLTINLDQNINDTSVTANFNVPGNQNFKDESNKKKTTNNFIKPLNSANNKYNKFENRNERNIFFIENNQTIAKFDSNDNLIVNLGEKQSSTEKNNLLNNNPIKNEISNSNQDARPERRVDTAQEKTNENKESENNDLPLAAAAKLLKDGYQRQKAEIDLGKAFIEGDLFSIIKQSITVFTSSRSGLNNIYELSNKTQRTLDEDLEKKVIDSALGYVSLGLELGTIIKYGSKALGPIGWGLAVYDGVNTVKDSIVAFGIGYDNHLEFWYNNPASYSGAYNSLTLERTPGDEPLGPPTARESKGPNRDYDLGLNNDQGASSRFDLDLGIGEERPDGFNLGLDLDLPDSGSSDYSPGLMEGIEQTIYEQSSDTPSQQDSSQTGQRENDQQSTSSSTNDTQVGETSNNSSNNSNNSNNSSDSNETSDKGDTSEGDDGFCFITTAICISTGLGDDCEILQILRNYRDNYLANLPTGPQEIQLYYEIAPQIVKHINHLPSRLLIWRNALDNYILPAVNAIQNNQLETAYFIYVSMINHMHSILEKSNLSEN